MQPSPGLQANIFTAGIKTDESERVLSHIDEQKRHPFGQALVVDAARRKAAAALHPRS
jgi:hypothetical protein